jgi:membrane protein implicated in regulation of membrane protease activity
MEEWVVWLVAAVILAAGEVASLSFYLAPFAGGAMAAALASAVGAGTVASGGAFLVVSALLFGFVRPIARRHTRMPPQLRTGTAALIGRSAQVLEPVSRSAGTVRLEGEVWTARAFDEDETIEAGKHVQVMEIRGATALVSE